MKSQTQLISLLTSLRSDLKKGRRSYWKAIHSGAYEDAENISLANMAIVAKIEVIELILE